MRDFNLLPERVLIEKKTKEAEKTVFIVTIVIASIIVTLTAWLYISTMMDQKKLDQINAEINEISFVQGLKNNLDSMEKSMSGKREAQKLIQSREQAIIKSLNFTEQILNKDITVTSLVINGNEIKMECMAKDKETIARFINKLRKSSDFEDTFVESIGAIEVEGNSEEGTASGTSMASGGKARKFTVDLVVKGIDVPEKKTASPVN